MKIKTVEDICIVLDNTLRFYGDHWVMVETSKGLANLVQLKLALEPGSRFALISFSDVVRIELDFDDFSLETFLNALNCIELSDSKVSHINQGLKIAYELTEKSMKNLVEGKKFRIIIISAGIFRKTDDNWKSLLEIFARVGIVIDTIQLSKSWDPKSLILEEIAKETRGSYYNSENVNEIEDILTELVKIQDSKEEVQSYEKDDLTVLEFVVEDLISIDNNAHLFENLRNSMIKTDEDMKCGICHSLECEDCKKSTFNCGSFCPECHRFFHQHCCAEWAKSQKDTPRTFFKCPVCFHILKIPDSFKRTIE